MDSEYFVYNMMTSFWRFYFILQLAASFCIVHAIIKFVKTEQSEIFILYSRTNDASMRRVPDEPATLRTLGIDSNITVVRYLDLLKQYRREPDVPSLKPLDRSPDELMRVLIQRVEVLAPYAYFVRSRRQIDLFNPAIERFRGLILSTSRYCVTQSETKLKFLWFNDYNFSVNTSFSAYNISSETKVEDFAFNVLQEDARILTLSNGSLAITYIAKPSLMGEVYQTLILADVDKSTGNIRLRDSMYMRSAELTGIGSHGKNWVMFEHNSSIMFMHSLNPSRIFEVVSRNPNDPHQAQIRLVHRGAHVALPWNAEFGTLRGGTAAVFVRGRYLSFFHTLAQFSFHTYFMGAIAFCPSFPFKIHSISPYPIVDYNWYQGRWYQKDKRIDYVVFPVGLMIDDDGESVWLSFGWQDITAFVLQIDLSGLFSSMELVNGSDCQAL